jgi:CIC family chloride channel protein
LIEALPRRAARDFTADSRMLMLSAIALVLGAISSVLAWFLLSLINLATNVFYFHTWSMKFRSPADNHLGAWVILVPVIGGLLVGIIARFGSEKVRGHGIPEALEAILLKGAKVDARVAFLKPIATAISIGSGGPFGAEGPIIVTSGATGSLIAQTFRLSDAERTTLMVAGAAAGMAATFSTPVAAVLLAVELLLFEWRPRSLVPVAVACAAAGVLRFFLLGSGPIFPMPLTVARTSIHAMLGAVLIGLAAGLLATVLGKSIYFFEDIFEKLPIHWMWWPAIGGVGIGIGGLIFPRALGVGYDVIRQLVAGNFTWKLILGVLIVKFLIWSFSLGSGTAGGVLAPLLMIGAALGAAFTHILPVIDPGGWPLLGSAAMVSGALGSPLTAAVLGLELTHNGGLLLPLLLASVTAYAVTVLIQPRSILTERLARRGHNLIREYGVDPLEVLTVQDVMRTSVLAIPKDATGKDAKRWLDAGGAQEPVERSAKRQVLFPVVDNGKLLGVVTQGALWMAASASDPGSISLASLAKPAKTVQPDETLRSIAEQMASTAITTFPVLDSRTEKLMGMVGIHEVLQARARSHDRESSRNTILRIRWPFGQDRKTEEESAEAVAALDAE